MLESNTGFTSHDFIYTNVINIMQMCGWKNENNHVYKYEYKYDITVNNGSINKFNFELRIFIKICVKIISPGLFNWQSLLNRSYVLQ